MDKAEQIAALEREIADLHQAAHPSQFRASVPVTDEERAAHKEQVAAAHAAGNRAAELRQQLHLLKL